MNLQTDAIKVFEFKYFQIMRINQISLVFSQQIIPKGFLG